MTPDYAALLGQWLPAVWRERDETGDLDRLLSVYGELLDAFHTTVEQRRLDNFPDAAADGGHCQPWLLPYFAQLLDVRMVSPDEDGRRAELADAVAWRQRKGTRVSIERIAEAVGRFEVEIQEGWQRVAVTPRIGQPLLPESSYGEEAIPASAGMDERARHPGLPAATVDLRYCSRAVQCEANNPAAHATRFAGQELDWRQIHRHGAPCAPGSFQDVSRRTPDLRTPGSRHGVGLYHPRRVSLFLPPPEGFCSARARTVNWSDLPQSALVKVETGSAKWNGETLPLYVYTGLDAVPVKIKGVISLTEKAIYRFHNLWLDNKLEVGDGAVQMQNCAARQVKVNTAERDVPVLEVRACLIKKVEAARGLVQLEYATVLDTLLAEHLNASDCILMPELRKDTVDKDVPAAGCIRYSRLFYLPGDEELASTPWKADGAISQLTCHTASCTTATPWFWSEAFGQPGCGVLHPDGPEVFQDGAEDGGEMGAYHDQRLVLRQKAVLEKLREFLPVGMEAALVLDPTLACPPPKT